MGNEKKEKIINNWGFILSITMGIVIGTTIQRQPGWDSRTLQTLYSAVIGALVGFTIFVLSRIILKIIKKK